MLLAIMLIGFLVFYLSIGLTSGRIYFALKLKHWHETVGYGYKTRRQLEQENKLAELEAKKEITDKTDKCENARREILRRQAAAKDMVEHLEDEKFKLERSISYRGSDAHVIVVDQIANGDFVQYYDKDATTLDAELDLVKIKLETARTRLSIAKKELYYHDKYKRSNSYYSKPVEKYAKCYEDYLEEEKSHFKPMSIVMVFLWPAALLWFSGSATLKHTIQFCDKFLHAEAMKTYVAPDEYRLEAKIKALTEKDPELAKMYAELAKTLEA